MNVIYPPYSQYHAVFGKIEDPETPTIRADLLERHNEIKKLLYPDPTSTDNYGSTIVAALSSIADIFSALAPILSPRPAPTVQFNIGNQNNSSVSRSQGDHRSDDNDEMSGTEAIVTAAGGTTVVLAGAKFAQGYHSVVEEAEESYVQLRKLRPASNLETDFIGNLQEMNSHIITAARTKRNLIYASILSSAGIIIGAVKRSKKVRDISAMITVGVGIVGVTCYIFNLFDVAKKCRQAFENNKNLISNLVLHEPRPQDEIEN